MTIFQRESRIAEFDWPKKTYPRNMNLQHRETWKIYISFQGESLPKSKSNSYLTTGATVLIARGVVGAKADAALALTTRAARVRRGAMVDWLWPNSTQSKRLSNLKERRIRHKDWVETSTRPNDIWMLFISFSFVSFLFCILNLVSVWHGTSKF
jgi:hypothetical protein